MSLNVSCKQCKSDFKVRSYRKGIAKYCNRQCAGIASRGRRPWNKNQKTLICKECNIEFKTPPSQAKRRIYCSHRCSSLNRAWTKEMKKKISRAFSGKGHPNWKGGKSLEPYGVEFNNNLKENIRKRDNYMCQECNYLQEDLSRKLSVHHIDYDKTNNKIENLISLCGSCHAQTNFGREEWSNYFIQKIL